MKQIPEFKLEFLFYCFSFWRFIEKQTICAVKKVYHPHEGWINNMVTCKFVNLCFWIWIYMVEHVPSSIACNDVCQISYNAKQSTVPKAYIYSNSLFNCFCSSDPFAGRCLFSFYIFSFLFKHLLIIIIKPKSR